MIRRATIADMPQAGRIINEAAEYGLMLHRSLAYLYEHVRDYYVAVQQPANVQGQATAADGEHPHDQVVGVCGLKVIWSDLAEVYALAVAPSQRGRGLGRRLVESCVEEARSLQIRRLMALTYERVFFDKLGFGVVDRQTLPLKVWNECVYCSRNQQCDEIAMVRELPDVPVIQAPDVADVTPMQDDDVPVTLMGRRIRPPVVA